MKRFKNIIYVLLILLVAIVIGYFVYCGFRFDSSLSLESFRNGFYKASNERDFLSFGNFHNSVMCVDDLYYFIVDLQYEDGIFRLSTAEEETYYVAVIDEKTLYCSSFNLYFYQLKG